MPCPHHEKNHLLLLGIKPWVAQSKPSDYALPASEPTLVQIYLRYPITQSRSQVGTVHTETAPRVTKSAAELPAAARRSSVTARYLITLSDPEFTWCW